MREYKIPTKTTKLLNNKTRINLKTVSLFAEYTHAKMADVMEDNIKIDPEIYLLFVFKFDNKCKKSFQ